MTQSRPGHGLAVAALITGIASIPLLGLCGLGIFTAVVGFILGVIAYRAAFQVPDGARGLATAGIIVNGVIVVLAAIGVGIFGLAVIGSLGTTALEKRKRPDAHETVQSSEASGAPSVPGLGLTNRPRESANIVPTASPISRSASLGESVNIGDLTLAVLAYSETANCPGGRGHPAEGAKFVVVQAHLRNAGTEVMRLPHIRWTLAQYDTSSGGCRYDSRSLGSACWTSGGRLFPNAKCEGWLLFEVPSGMAIVGETFRAALTAPGGGTSEYAAWRTKP